MMLQNDLYMKNNALKIVTFLVVIAGMRTSLYFLQLAMQNHPDWASMKVIHDTLEDPLNGIISTSTATLCALLIPLFKVQEPKKAPDSPSVPQLVVPSGQASVPLSEYQDVVKALDKWNIYKADVDKYVVAMESLRTELNTRQAVLRVSAYAIVALAFAIAVAGFLQSPFGTVSANSTVGSPNSVLLLKHFEYLTVAAALIGLLIGVVIFRIGAYTTARNAGKSAGLAALILGLGSFLVSLPYVYPTMGTQTVIFGNCQLPILVWTALFRLGVFPIICMISSYVAYQVVGLLVPPNR
jgi:hypothetical protein